MKYLLLIAVFLFGCYAPQKEWYELRQMTLSEIHKTENGYDLIWSDDFREVKQFVTDTTGANYRIGAKHIVLMPR